jgi:glycosyltransferase involved in cell wall biosynthesis
MPERAPTAAAEPAAASRPEISAGQKRMTRSYRVLKIAPTAFFSDYGCHVRILEETRALQRLGNRVVICTYHTGSDPPGICVRRALNTPWWRSIRVGPSRRKFFYDFWLLLKTFETALAFRPHVIHAHLHEGALIGTLVGRALGTPVVFDFQGSLTSEMVDHRFLDSASIWYRPLRLLEWVIDHWAAVVVTSSRNAAEVLVREFGYPRAKVRTVPDCVDAATFRPRWLRDDLDRVERLRAALGIPADRKVVVYLGLLAEYQGTGLLLEAARRLIDRSLPVHFLIMGFPGEEAYRSRAEQLGIGRFVTFTGRVSYALAPDYLLIGDVAVSPKISETEGNGKLLNYMACGLPTVAFETPVATEILGDAGVYARTGDPDSLAERIAGLLTDPEWAGAVGRRLRRRAEAYFSWDWAALRFAELYKELAG